MGTSKAYSASIKNKPQWGKLSSIVTSTCGTASAPDKSLGKILGRYVDVLGGTASAGRGASKIGGRASARTAKRLGGFFAAFGTAGGDLLATLDALGLKGLAGKPLKDILNQLIEYLTGPATFIDDVAAKAAANKLLEEIAANAASIEEFQENISELLDTASLEDILVRYFGYYIYEHLSIMFYEKLVEEKGKTDCNNLFSQIGEYILEKLSNMNKSNSLTKISWGGADAERIIYNIQEDVLTVFENYED